MRRVLAAFVLMLIAAAASPAHADPVTLRARIEASGPAITLGDVFDGAGAASGRAIAPAPPPGQVTTLSAALLSAAASAAGLDWSPSAGQGDVRVVRPGGMRATLAPSSPVNGVGRVVADAAIRRGEMVTLVYRIGGLQLSTHARALEDGAIGQGIRLVNLTSNRTVDGTVTGPGAASAAAP